MLIRASLTVVSRCRKVTLTLSSRGTVPHVLVSPMARPALHPEFRWRPGTGLGGSARRCRGVTSKLPRSLVTRDKHVWIRYAWPCGRYRRRKRRKRRRRPSRCSRWRCPERRMCEGVISSSARLAHARASSELLTLSKTCLSCLRPWRVAVRLATPCGTPWHVQITRL